MASAQQDLSEVVRAMFDDTTHLEWLNTYKGTVDNMTIVEAFLGSDGSYCKGILYYPSSGFSTEIVGSAIGNKLQMNEVNGEGFITGKLLGTITFDFINATWSNQSNTIGSKYRLKNVSAIVKTAIKENNEKWVRWYKGKVSDEMLHLILHKKTDNEVYGSCYNETGTKSYHVKGMLNDDKSLHLNFYLGEQQMAIFTGKMPRAKVIKGNVSGIGMVNEELNMYLDNKINYQQTAFQSFTTSYEVLMPENGAKEFDRFIKNITGDWVKQCIEKSNSKTYKESDNTIPEERLINRAYIYPDIRYVADNVISGHMIFVNTWNAKTLTKAINFDLNEDKEITLDQLFTKDISFRDSLNIYIKATGNDVFKISYFNITPEGLRVYDDFDPINGRNDIIVPYSVLRPWVKKNGPLKKLL